MKGLYRFFASCGRMGSLEGVFIADQAEIDAAMGENLGFGEVLGKHSDIDIDLEPAHIKLLTADSLAIQVVEQYGLTSGFNPLEYRQCETCYERSRYHEEPFPCEEEDE